MHELSIAYNLVEIAVETAEQNHLQKVDVLHVKIGVLSGVVKEALEFSFDIAAQGTPIEGAKLVVHEVPLKIFCPNCHKMHVLKKPIPLVCPECRQRTGEIVEGKEIELYSLEGGDVLEPSD